MTENPFIKSNGQPIVYVREVATDEMPDGLRGTDAKLFALHDAEGNRLAVTPDRGVAFALAKRNDMVPLSVH
jgi:hypothetical protein